jgi:hypothetical protein
VAGFTVLSLAKIAKHFAFLGSLGRIKQTGLILFTAKLP